MSGGSTVAARILSHSAPSAADAASFWGGWFDLEVRRDAVGRAHLYAKVYGGDSNSVSACLDVCAVGPAEGAGAAEVCAPTLLSAASGSGSGSGSGAAAAFTDSELGADPGLSNAAALLPTSNAGAAVSRIAARSWTVVSSHGPGTGQAVDYVGVNTSTPAFELDVAGRINARAGLLVNGVPMLDADGSIHCTSLGVSGPTALAGSLSVGGTATLAGPLGVGRTASQGYTLDVEGNARFGAASFRTLADAMYLVHEAQAPASTASAFALLQGLDGGVSLNAAAGTPLVLSVGARETARVSPSGMFGIGTTDPGYTLHVVGDPSTATVMTNGDVTAYSDARHKTDVRPIADALAKLRRIGGYTFLRTDRRAGVGAATRRTAGVLAQEVRAVLPEVVHEDAGTGTLSVAYGNMSALLIEALKQLDTRLLALEVGGAAPQTPPSLTWRV